MDGPLLEIEDLTVEFPAAKGVLRAVDGVSLTLSAGESLGLVGESGCGKTVTALAIVGLIPQPGRVRGGRVCFRGRDLLNLSESERRDLRGREITMVFQEPARSLNPVLRCGDQVVEVLTAHLRLDRRTVRARVLSLLEQVGLRDARALYDAYPHQLSGGMRQRVMIAMALACDPVLLVADEPTTALDVTVEAQIVSLLEGLKRARDLSILFIAHNLALVSQACERVAVMYAGQLVEVAWADEIFEAPRHPYTRALVDCLPSLDGPITPPRPIPGEVPHPLVRPAGCRFSDRCGETRGVCRDREPKLEPVGEGHWVRCWIAANDGGGSI